MPAANWLGVVVCPTLVSVSNLKLAACLNEGDSAELQLGAIGRVRA